MNTQAMDSVLNLLRSAAAQAAGGKVQRSVAGADFAKSLSKAVDAVNEQQMQAQDLANAKAAGSPVDVSQVMVALEKADLSFQEMVEVRNKLVSAYQEIMNLQI